MTSRMSTANQKRDWPDQLPSERLNWAGEKAPNRPATAIRMPTAKTR